MTPAEVLNKAADIIEENGWAQGEYVKRVDGKVCGFCVRGAMIAAVDPEFFEGPGDTFAAMDAERFEAYRVAGNALGDFVGREPVGFNDYVATSASEVIAALRFAAESAA